MSSHIFNFRRWMYDQWDSNGQISKEFAEGLNEFMRFAGNQEITLREGKTFCPCIRCDNSKFIPIERVWNHLYQYGFTPNYKIWYFHGEVDTGNMPSTSEYVPVNLEEPRMVVESSDTMQMVNDAFRENISSFIEDGERVEEPNLEARRFFDMLDAAKHPIYEGCKKDHSPLSAATRMMTIKSDFNLAEDCVDAIADFVKDYLPEDNMCPASYDEVDKLVSGLGLPFQMIDVCIDNCMIYWKVDANYLACKFCGKPRFKVTSGRAKVPYKRMWYLPLADRLKRLYQSERTASAMRWHKEHSSEGEIVHPSDAKAWKHFQSVYEEFASESRNVYQ